MQFINYNFSDVSSFSFAVQFFLRAMVLWFCLYLMSFSMFFLLIFRTNPTRYILLVTLLAGSIYCWIYIVGHFACWIDQYIAGYISHLAAARWSMQEKKYAIWHINRVSQGHGTRLIGILCHGELYKPSVPDAGTRLIGYVKPWMSYKPCTKAPGLYLNRAVRVDTRFIFKPCGSWALILYLNRVALVGTRFIYKPCGSCRHSVYI